MRRERDGHIQPATPARANNIATVPWPTPDTATEHEFGVHASRAVSLVGRSVDLAAEVVSQTCWMLRCTAAANATRSSRPPETPAPEQPPPALLRLARREFACIVAARDGAAAPLGIGTPSVQLSSACLTRFGGESARLSGPRRGRRRQAASLVPRLAPGRHDAMRRSVACRSVSPSSRRWIEARTGISLGRRHPRSFETRSAATGRGAEPRGAVADRLRCCAEGEVV